MDGRAATPKATILPNCKLLGKSRTLDTPFYSHMLEVSCLHKARSATATNEFEWVAVVPVITKVL
jgi:hypothetical protein